MKDFCSKIFLMWHFISIVLASDSNKSVVKFWQLESTSLHNSFTPMHPNESFSLNFYWFFVLFFFFFFILFILFFCGLFRWGLVFVLSMLFIPSWILIGFCILAVICKLLGFFAHEIKRIRRNSWACLGPAKPKH